MPLRIVTVAPEAPTPANDAVAATSGMYPASLSPDSAVPPQTLAQPFVALSWSPFAVAPERGCLLLAAVAESCVVYARPLNPAQLSLAPIASLGPLLHAALGLSSPPSEAERHAVRVHSSSWAATSENTFCTKPERTCASTVPRSMFTSSGTPSYVTSTGSAFCLAGL